MVKYLSMPSYPIQMIRKKKKKKKMSFQMSSKTFRELSNEFVQNFLLLCFSGEEKKSDFFRISFLNEWYGSTSHSVRSIIYTFYETKHKLLADSLSSHFWSPNGFWIWNSRIKKIEVQMEMNQLIRTREL